MLLRFLLRGVAALNSPKVTTDQVMVRIPGRHFLQLPGPTNVPDRILRAMDRPTIDHRGPAFAELTHEILSGLRGVFQTEGEVLVYPASASGSWEAALVNTLSPGDRVLMCDHGFFAANWRGIAERVGLIVDVVEGDWRDAVDPGVVRAKLIADTAHAYRAVAVVHNETSTGVTSAVAPIGRVIAEVGHPALFLVDAVSSLASMDYRHDDWGVDVTVAGSQKGLMLPPGLSFTCVSDKALAANKSAALPRSYWDWEQMRAFNRDGFFPYTPATNLLFGLQESLRMLREEGFERVFRRHHRLAEATRRAVVAWGLEIFCREAEARSDTVTAVMMPDGHDANDFRRAVLDRLNMSLGGGLGKLKGHIFRIGHLGDFNDLMLAGTLSGIEMGLALAGVPHEPGGVEAALVYLVEHQP